jgi:hypothetical protein
VRIIFSRKGFDSASGGAPSPIIDGIPISLPIPGRAGQSETTYGCLGLGELVRSATRGRMNADDLCHNDPMFENGRWAFGQTDKAQAHLAKQGVTIGDVFLFFGLFREPGTGDDHHRIFGYLQIDEILRLGPRPSMDDQPRGFTRRHPHTIGQWEANNTVYVGTGARATKASSTLRLSKPGAVKSQWVVPTWLAETGLSFHSDPDRWQRGNELRVVGRGQEFVAVVGDRAAPRAWLRETIDAINCG